MMEHQLMVTVYHHWSFQVFCSGRYWPDWELSSWSMSVSLRPWFVHPSDLCRGALHLQRLC